MTHFLHRRASTLSSNLVELIEDLLASILNEKQVYELSNLFNTPCFLNPT